MKNFRKFPAFFILSLTIFALCVSMISCSKDKEDDNDPYSCSTCARTPEALPENDNSARGIYKGIGVGSSGTLHLDIQNGSSEIKATMILDGITANLTSNVEYIDGQPYVAPFTGVYNGNPMSITFRVAYGGSEPQVVSSDIPGHPNAVFTVYKETSTSLIEAFEGTYSGADSGTFNILLSRSLGLWGGVAKENTPDAYPEGINGRIQGDKLFEGESNTEIATLKGDVLSGKFQNGDGKTINVSGHRTL